MSITIDSFLSAHSASNEFSEWAQQQGIATMQELWERLPPYWKVWTATRPGVLTPSTMRLFVLQRAQKVRHRLTDPRSVEAVKVANRYTRGQASWEEMKQVRKAAWAAMKDMETFCSCNKAAKPKVAKAGESVLMAIRREEWETAAVWAAQVVNMATVELEKAAAFNAELSGRMEAAAQAALVVEQHSAIVAAVAATVAWATPQDAQWLAEHAQPNFEERT